MAELIGVVPAYIYSIRIYKEKELLKRWGHTPYSSIMGALLEQVTFEENFILSFKRSKMSKTDKWIDRKWKTVFLIRNSFSPIKSTYSCT